jgi:flagellar protein FlaI
MSGIGQLRRLIDVVLPNTVSFDNFDMDKAGQLTEFTLPPHAEELDRYWVDAPFCYTVIYYDQKEDEQRYHLVEPTLSEFDRELLDNLQKDIRDRLVYLSDEPTANLDGEETIRHAMEKVLENYGSNLDSSQFYSLLYYIRRRFEGFGKIRPLLLDNHIEDISCDGYGMPIFLYHDEYIDIKTNITLEQQALDDLVIRLGQMSNRQMSVGEPITNATLPDGSRAELVYTEEVSPNGSAFTIRQYDEETMTPVELIEYETFSVEQMVYFWLAIENNMNLIFAGGTASGKTTSLNAVSMFMTPSSKVITIEDTREMSLAHENWLSNVTRERLSEGKTIDMYDLLRSALRHRPEYIIVGEVRGEEATTLFQAMNTGHTTFSTMHADSVQTAINRLENEPINVPRAMVQSLDILSVQRLARRDGQRIRRADSIVELQGIDQRSGELSYNNVYSWDAPRDEVQGDIGESTVIDRIKEKRGWSSAELLSEIQDRRRILQYMVDEDISRYDRFTAVIDKYYSSPTKVLDWVEGDRDSPIGIPERAANAD